MKNDMLYCVLLMATIVAANLLTRILPYLIFERGGKVPKFVEYLGNVLPPAMMSFLLIYCIRDVKFDMPSNWMPEIISVAVAIILHAFKRNTLLSICVSTILYMILVQYVFI